jgi:hypothetical protein
MAAPKTNARKNEMYRDSSKKKDVRTSNIEAAKAVADAVRTSLGPRGMDKMVGLASGAPGPCWGSRRAGGEADGPCMFPFRCAPPC